MLVCVYYYLFELDPKYKDTSISSFFNLGWYAWESLKNVLVVMWVWITDDILIYFVTAISTVEDVAVLGIFVTAQNIIIIFFTSLVLYASTGINRLLGSRDFKRAKILTAKFFLIFVVCSVLLNGAIYAVIKFQFLHIFKQGSL